MEPGEALCVDAKAALFAVTKGDFTNIILEGDVINVINLL